MEPVAAASGIPPGPAHQRRPRIPTSAGQFSFMGRDLSIYLPSVLDWFITKPYGIMTQPDLLREAGFRGHSCEPGKRRLRRRV